MTLTWIGGGNNKASNPLLWSPTGGPAPGESLSVTAAPQNPGPFIINVRGNDLAGDTLSIGAQLTANLSKDALVSADVLADATATFNLSHYSALNVSLDASNITVNVSGYDNATIATTRGSATVNLDKGARLSGTIEGGYAGTVTVQGGADSAFNNSGDSAVGENESGLASATVGVDVIGRGTFTVGPTGYIEFAKSVGPGQSIATGGLVEIDEPRQFHASVTLVGGPAQVDLAGLASADSYSFKNDLLNIWSSNKIIDTLRLTDETKYGFVVEPPTPSGSVNIVAILDPNNIPSGLPVHA